MATKKVSKKTSFTDIDRKDIPYNKITITCACGASYESGSTLKSIRVDICSACHPFFTGDSKYLDTEGRVEKFMKKYNMKSKS